MLVKVTTQGQWYHTAQESSNTNDSFPGANKYFLEKEIATGPQPTHSI